MASCTTARAPVARLRAHGATRFPLGSTGRRRGTPALVVCSLSVGRRGAAKRPVARIGARDTRYRPAITRRLAAAQLRLLLPSPHFCPADARCDAARERIAPSPNAHITTRPELRSASIDHEWSRGASHTAASAPHGARVLRGKHVRCCCSVLRALQVLRHGHAGVATPGSTRGRRALLNDFARQGNPMC